MDDQVHLKVSFLIFSRTSHGPRETYCKNVSAEIFSTRRRIFHIRGRRVESYERNSQRTVSLFNPALLRTILDGMPSTRIIRLTFFSPSSTSPDRLDFDDLYWFKILLNEWAAAAAWFGDEDMGVFVMSGCRHRLLSRSHQTLCSYQSRSLMHMSSYQLV